MQNIFTCSYCDPLKSNVVTIGDFSRDEAEKQLRNFNWEQDFARLEEAESNGKTIYYSPSFSIKNKENKAWIEASYVGNKEFYIFCGLEKEKEVMKKKFLFFGPETKATTTVSVSGDITGQTIADVEEIFNLLLDNKLSELEAKF